MFKFLFFLFTIFCNVYTVDACSRIFSNTQPNFKACARTMDWHELLGDELQIYPREVIQNGSFCSWISQYGSLCIVAKNYESAVVEGVNEKGLAAHLLYMEDTIYEKRDETRPAITYAEWARYVLDTCSSVNQAVEVLSKVQVLQVLIHENVYPVHLALADAHGDSAIIECIDGKHIVHHGKNYTVCTNEPSYTRQLENLRSYLPFEDFHIPGGVESKDRFVRAQYFLQNVTLSQSDPIASVFSLIATVSIPWKFRDTKTTLWTSVIDLTQKKYYFRSCITQSNFFIDMIKLDFSKNNSHLFLDPHAPDLVGDATSRLRRFENF